ncbi:hypothetical protein IMSHALPRED_002641 [Imshaugia aleurites]|uniref:Uncharacterized protein n=1 Tax=Imshaugia aleurites TaxID=172621 RepID=A0A8H3IEI0_9LECA|nr:hypothetical protein IMSHALPRED_002641 [Imshaugia aleurites]
MHLATKHTLAAILCALSASALPLPLPGAQSTDTDTVTLDIPSGKQQSPPPSLFSPTPPLLPHPLQTKPPTNPSDPHPSAFPVHWYTNSRNPLRLRRRDSPLRNLFSSKDGFIETGSETKTETKTKTEPETKTKPSSETIETSAHAPRDENEVAWLTPPPSSPDGGDYDPLRRRRDIIPVAVGT